MKRVVLILVVTLAVGASALEVVRQQNAATYLTFPIIDVNGAMVSSAAGLDSEYVDFNDVNAPGTFTDCTNEATEIGSTGWYSLSVTAAELNYDYVAFQIKSSDGNNLTQNILVRTLTGDPLALMTTADGVDVTSISGDSTAADNLESAYDGGSYNVGGGAIVAASVTAQVTADVNQISGDPNAADNLESMYDGTGYVADSAPASRDQIAALSGGISIQAIADGNVVTQGTDGNDYSYTYTDDGTYYRVTDSGSGAGIDFYLTFDITSLGVPVLFDMQGYYDEGTGATNSLYIQAYNNNTSAWHTLTTLSDAASDETVEVSLTAVDVNDANQVKIRFLQDTQEADSRMYIDQAYVSYVTSPYTPAQIADQVWDEAYADHNDADTFGGLVNSLIIYRTTVASPNDANNFTITAGHDANDAYWMCQIVVEDATDGHREARWIAQYEVSRDVSVDYPFTFTPAASDKVWIVSNYGGFLDAIFDQTGSSSSAVYYYDATTGSGASEGPTGVTYLDQSGADP